MPCNCRGVGVPKVKAPPGGRIGKPAVLKPPRIRLPPAIGRAAALAPQIKPIKAIGKPAQVRPKKVTPKIGKAIRVKPCTNCS